MHSPQHQSGEQYPHLAAPPIVEALIDWRAVATADLREVATSLRARLPDYPTVDSLHQFEWSMERNPASTTQSHSEEWLGHRLDSDDRRKVAQFTRLGFTFSWLAPYESWAVFVREAMRLWSVYASVARPVAIDRLGVRFINRLSGVRIDQLEKTIQSVPPTPLQSGAMPEEFLQRIVYRIPDAPLKASIAIASEPRTPPAIQPSLLVDVDVFSTAPIECGIDGIEQQLNAMRHLKNRAFFSILTSDAIASLQEVNP